MNSSNSSTFQLFQKYCNFSIITLVFNKNDGLSNVPNLLKKYVVKNPKTRLEALREIIKALPLKIGKINRINL